MSTRGPGRINFDQLWTADVPWRAIGLGIVVLFALGLLWSCVYTINPEEVGVVQTFGRHSRTTDPGLRFKWPWPIETVTKVPVQEQLKQQFGIRTAGGTDESLMLTGDLNVGVVEWTTQYRVSDPFLYLFKVRNLDETFRDMNEAVMREVVGDRSVNELLTIGRQEIASEVETHLQALCDQYETGIHVEQIVLQDVNPPDQVKPAFNEVNQAQQEKERMINMARADYNRVIPRARGEALQTIQQAEGYATDRVNRAKGDAALFQALLAAYQRSPEVTRQRIYLETMKAIYPRVRHKIILDEALQGVLPLLPLGGEGRP